jgi:LAS superfamily LD-carboxypeptidase LdcB
MPRGFGPTQASRAEAIPTGEIRLSGPVEFPLAGEEETGGQPNVERANPELIRRTNAAFKAAQAEGARFSVVSGYRPATRAEARALGMSESSSQEDIYERSRGGALFAAAPPGRSHHQQGLAFDVRDPTGWLHQHAARFGLHFPYRHDYPHMEMLPGWEPPVASR